MEKCLKKKFEEFSACVHSLAFSLSKAYTHTQINVTSVKVRERKCQYAAYKHGIFSQLLFYTVLHICKLLFSVINLFFAWMNVRKKEEEKNGRVDVKMHDRNHDSNDSNHVSFNLIFFCSFTCTT